MSCSRHKGEFVVIKGTSVLGYFRDRPSAVTAAIKKYGAVSVLVKQVVEQEPVRHLRDVVL